MIRGIANEMNHLIDADTPQRVMLDLAARANPRLARMRPDRPQPKAISSLSPGDNLLLAISRVPGGR